MNIYISQSGQQFGPFYIEQVIQFFNEGRIQPNDLIWYPDRSDWITVGNFFSGQSHSISTSVPPNPDEAAAATPATANGTTIEQLIAKRTQLRSIIVRLQSVIRDRDAQRFQHQLDEIAHSPHESLWFRQSRANLSTELKHQNLETLRQIANYERQIAQLEVEIERVSRGI